MKEVRELLKMVAIKNNMPTSSGQAIEMGVEHYLAIDFSYCYGGYMIVNVGVSNGGHYGAFGKSSCCARLSKKQMVSYLQDLLYS